MNTNRFSHELDWGQTNRFTSAGAQIIFAVSKTRGITGVNQEFVKEMTDDGERVKLNIDFDVDGDYILDRSYFKEGDFDIAPKILRLVRKKVKAVKKAISAKEDVADARIRTVVHEPRKGTRMGFYYRDRVPVIRVVVVLVTRIMTNRECKKLMKQDPCKDCPYYLDCSPDECEVWQEYQLEVRG